jgi:hypothetical protein
MHKISVLELSFYFGLAWSAVIALLGIIALKNQTARNILNFLSTVYRGFTPDLPGIITGTAWGFVDGAITGAIIAFIYNLIAG